MLAEDIRQRLSFHSGGGDDALRDVFSRLQGSSASIFLAASVIAKGLSSFKSIDDFLFSHSGNAWTMLIGKLAIVRAIADYEKQNFVARLWSSEDAAREEAHAKIRKTGHRLWSNSS